MPGLFGEIQIRSSWLPGMGRRLREEASRIVKAAALDCEGRAKASMGEGKSGRIYERAGGQTHQASAPGEAPAIDIGNLINSIQTEEESELSQVVSVGAEYGIFLEYGTSHMAPRPFMTPAAEAARGPFLRNMETIGDHLD